MGRVSQWESPELHPVQTDGPSASPWRGVRCEERGLALARPQRQVGQGHLLCHSGSQPSAFPADPRRGQPSPARTGLLPGVFLPWVPAVCPLYPFRLARVPEPCVFPGDKDARSPSSRRQSWQGAFCKDQEHLGSFSEGQAAGLCLQCCLPCGSSLGASCPPWPLAPGPCPLAFPTLWSPGFAEPRPRRQRCKQKSGRTKARASAGTKRY